MPMSNQDKFEREARVICERNQAAMDLKAYLYQWSGSQEVRARHKKELQDLAKKFEVELDFKKWKLNGN